jgi:Zn-dependent protease with chaperone function
MQTHNDTDTGIELGQTWAALYVLTVAAEIPAMLARYFAGLVVATVVLRVSGQVGGIVAGSAASWGKIAAVGPIVWSAAALLSPRGGAWWWRQRTGGREPSEREREIYRNAIVRLQAQTSMPLPMPESWFVVDVATPEAAVYGYTLMLSSGALALDDVHLQALLAHEVGHLRSIDARLTVAVNRLVLKPFSPLATQMPTGANNPSHSARTWGLKTPSRPPAPAPVPRGLLAWTLRAAAVLLRGGVGLRLTASSWGALWREQEYAADSWAASIGAGSALADFLQTYVLELDHPIPLVGLTSHTHPPTELRIDRLRRVEQLQPSTAPNGEPRWMTQERARTR